MKNKICIIEISIIVLATVLSGCTTNNENTNQQENGSTNQPQLLEWTREEGIRIENGVSSSTIIINDTYIMYYTAQGICMATSSDGITYSLLGTVIDAGEPGSGQEMVSNSAIIQLQNGSYRMIYEGSRWLQSDPEKGDQPPQQVDRRFYSAFSPDGYTWVKEEGIRYEDAEDPYTIFTSVPDIIRLDNGDLRMYYTGAVDSATAISHDEGITWTKEQNLDLGRIVVDCDIVRLPDTTYKLFFTSFDSQFGIGKQYVMSASSTDGLSFMLDSGKRLEPASESTPIYDPDVIRLPDGTYRMYYSQVEQAGVTRILSATSSLS